MTHRLGELSQELSLFPRANFIERGFLNLPNPFQTDPQVGSDLGQSARRLTIEPKALSQHVLLTLGQPLDGVTQVTGEAGHKREVS